MNRVTQFIHKLHQSMGDKQDVLLKIMGSNPNHGWTELEMATRTDALPRFMRRSLDALESCGLVISYWCASATGGSSCLVYRLTPEGERQAVYLRLFTQR